MMKYKKYKSGIIHLLPLLLVTALIIAVGAGAYYFGMNSNQPLISKQEPVEVVEDTGGETLTYEDVDFGIKFEYPNEDMLVEKNAEELFIGFRSPQYVPYLIITRENNVDLDSLEICQNIFDQDSSYFPCLKETPQMLDVSGESAISAFIYKDAFESYYRIIQIPGRQFQLEFYVTPNRFIPASDHTISTFEFIDSEEIVDMSDWETYESDEYGFRMDYISVIDEDRFAEIKQNPFYLYPDQESIHFTYVRDNPVTPDDYGAGTGFIISIFENPNNLDVKDWWNSTFSLDFEPEIAFANREKQDFIDEETTLGNNRVVKTKHRLFDRYKYIIANENHAFVFTLEPNKMIKEEIPNNIEKILSTFEFIN